VRRVADLHLRGAAGPLAARVLWPQLTPARPGLLVLYPGGPAAPASTEGLGRALCAGAGLVVVRPLRIPSLGEAVAAVEWAADHGFELGADAARLVVAGYGAGAGLAAAVAVQARDQGWPALARQLLVLPAFPVVLPGSLAGVAPATVVARTGDDAGARYARRLRNDGVDADLLAFDAARLAGGLARSLTAEPA
jgi:acetyl esterase